ncbi:MAG: hypothetical protein ABIH83_05720 [Candidatus Micrarchaeota archaeon]
MSSIRKTVLVGGQEHYIQVDSSLELEEVEITGSDPATGKTVHISLTSLLKKPSQPEPSPVSPQPLQMFDSSEGESKEEAPVLGGGESKSENSEDVINDLFG